MTLLQKSRYGHCASVTFAERFGHVIDTGSSGFPAEAIATARPNTREKPVRVIVFMLGFSEVRGEKFMFGFMIRNKRNNAKAPFSSSRFGLGGDGPPLTRDPTGVARA